MTHRSGCPINLTVEILGDRWSIIVLRDMMFGSRRTYGQLLNNSLEGIASNILAARLKHMEAEGLITVAQDAGHRQRRIYSLTEKAIQLVPVIAQLGAWGVVYTSCAPELSIRAKLLADGGPTLWAAFMEELRSIHLGAHSQPDATSVLERLNLAYMAATEAGGGSE